MQILIVEDEVLLAKSLQEILEDSGHEVSLAYDGQEGLELARSTPFDQERIIISRNPLIRENCLPVSMHFFGGKGKK